MDIVEHVEGLLAADKENCGWRGVVVQLLEVLKSEREAATSEYARGEANAEDRLIAATTEMSLDLDKLLGVATLYVDAFEVDEKMTWTEKLRLQEIEEILERRGKQY